MGEPAAHVQDIGIILKQRFGIAVVVRNLRSARVTAVAVRAVGSAAIVLCSSDPHRANNPLLARVYLAHELCHVLFDPSPGGLHIVIDAATDKKDLAAERRARAFAAEFLLPNDGLVQLLGSPRNFREYSGALDMVAKVRSVFGTPHEVTANHLCNLHFIDLDLRDWLEAERTKFTNSLPTTTLPSTDAPSTAVETYLQRAHREGIITDTEARAALGVDKLAPLPWEEVEL